MKQPTYRIEENIKYQNVHGHKYLDESSTITAIVTFFSDSNLMRHVLLVYSWNVDGDADGEGNPVDLSHWSPRLDGKVEDIQLFAEKHTESFKQIPNKNIRSPDPEEVKGDLEYFFEQSGIVAE